MDEWGLIEKKIPSFDLVFEMRSRARSLTSDVELNDEQRAVLELVDGTRDVQAHHRRVGPRGVRGRQGAVRPGHRRLHPPHRQDDAPATPAATEGRVEEHRNLGIAFYKTGMLDEAMREFRRVLELRSDDTVARFYLGLVLARQRKWDDALAAFAEAAAQPGAKAAVFHNLAYALEQLDRYDEARVALDEAVRRGGGDDPRVQTSLGVVNLLAGDLAAADAALTAARPLFGNRPPTPAWFHYMGLDRRAARRRRARRGDPQRRRGRASARRGAAQQPRGGARARRATTTRRATIAERGVHEDPRRGAAAQESRRPALSRRRATTRRSRRTCAR